MKKRYVVVQAMVDPKDHNRFVGFAFGESEWFEAKEFSPIRKSNMHNINIQEAKEDLKSHIRQLKRVNKLIPIGKTITTNGNKTPNYVGYF